MSAKQLPGTDAVFLALETDVIHGHVGALIILDPSGSTAFSFDRVRRTVVERIQQVPRFTWQLNRVPLSLDRPYWVGAADFDAARHLHRIAVPAPGGLTELAEVCGLLASQKLDFRKPLWEIWYIEGLANGRVAILFKMHHCIADGVSGAEIGTLLCDLDAAAPESSVLAAAERPAPPPPPDLMTVWWNGAAHLAGTPLRVAEYLGQMVRRGVISLRHGAGSADAAPGIGSIPRLPFNAAIGPKRAFAFATIPFADVKEVRRQVDVKINDILVALSVSSMRRYLQARKALPAEPLVVMCAVSTRGTDNKELTNQVSTMHIACRTRSNDPLARLLQIHRSAMAAKKLTSRVDQVPIPALGETFPPALIAAAVRVLAPFGNYLPVFCNVAVSNVPGPPVPLYSAGARIEAMYPLSVLGPGVGLNFTAISYTNRFDFGIIADPDLVDDPWELANGVPLAMAELKAAIARRARGGAKGQRRSVRGPAGKRRSGKRAGRARRGG